MWNYSEQGFLIKRSRTVLTAKENGVECLNSYAETKTVSKHQVVTQDLHIL